MAQMCRTGWFKQVHMKVSATHIDWAALKIRQQLITSRNAFANEVRGMLKLFGLRIVACIQITRPDERDQVSEGRGP